MGELVKIEKSVGEAKGPGDKKNRRQKAKQGEDWISRQVLITFGAPTYNQNQHKKKIERGKLQQRKRPGGGKKRPMPDKILVSKSIKTQGKQRRD